MLQLIEGGQAPERLDPLRAPFPWFGGKSRAAALIWQRLGDVSNYVEPFAGSLAVLLGRPHVPRLETVNDRDAYLCNFWRATQEAPDEVARWADWPVNETDLHARHLWLVETGRERVERLAGDPNFFDPQVAGWWVWGISQWIGGGWCAGTRDHESNRPSLSRPQGVHAKRPQLGPGERGVTKKRPHLSSNGPGVGVHQQRPALGNGGGIGVHRQLPALYGRKGIEARRGALVEWFEALQERLRSVRVCCGDWSRVVTPSVTHKVGGSMLTGVLLDPPYSRATGRAGGLYLGETRRSYVADEGTAELSHQVRDWAIENGDNPLLRIALCGYEGEHSLPVGWTCEPWKAPGGYGSQRKSGANENGQRERIWFSPHCLQPSGPRQAHLFEDQP